MKKFPEPINRLAWVHVLIGLVCYTVIFYWLARNLGGTATLLSVFPMLVGAWYFGIPGGILTTIGTILLSSLVLVITESTSLETSWDEALAGTIGLFLLSFIAGYVSRLLHKYKEMISQRVFVAEKLEQQATFLTLLTNITYLVLESDDIHSVLEALTSQLRNIFQADDCLICLWDEKQGIPVPTVADGLRKNSLEKIRFKKGEKTLAMLSLEENKVLAIDDPSHTPQSISESSLHHIKGPVLTLPLLSNEQKLGVLLLFYNQPRVFSENENTYAKLTSQQLSLAIAKTYLLDTTRQQVNELKILHEIATSISTNNDIKHLSEQVVQIISKFFYTNHLGILLVNEEKQVVQLQALYHSGGKVPFPELPLGEGISGQVVQSGETIYIPDVSVAPNYFKVTTNTRSEICVPIKLGGEVLGVINAESDKLDAFSKKDETFLTTVAHQLATAFARIRVAAEQLRKAEEIEHSNQLIHALSKIATRMETSSQPDEIMTILGEQLIPLGWNTLITLLVPGSQDMVIRYTSIDDEIIKKFERLANRTLMPEFRISSDQLPKELNVFENTQPAIVSNHIDVIAAVLKDFPPEIVQRLLQPAGITETVKLGHFPLIFQDKILGFLWLWGEELQEKDIPTVSLFANQVAAALENARLFADVQHLAVTDSLTGLHTRRHFFELAFEEFYRARRYGHPLSIIMLDLDHFKRINDHYGHSAGDAALQSAANICQAALRNVDLIGRYGGEEFVVLLTETTIQDAEKTASRLCKTLSQMIVPTPKGNIQITASGGVAGDNVEEMNLIEMIEVADQALLRAKKAGRNTIRVGVPNQKEDKSVV